MKNPEALRLPYPLYCFCRFFGSVPYEKPNEHYCAVLWIDVMACTCMTGGANY
jgi:hypothetical protein